MAAWVETSDLVIGLRAVITQTSHTGESLFGVGRVRVPQVSTRGVANVGDDSEPEPYSKRPSNVCHMSAGMFALLCQAEHNWRLKWTE